MKKTNQHNYYQTNINTSDKKQKKKLKTYFLLFSMLSLFFSISLKAQVYPVNVTPQLVPPYSLKLSEYQTTASEKLFVNLLLTDTQESNRQVRLKMYIEGQGLNIQSNDFIIGAAPIFLDGGINQRISNIDLRPYFNFNNLSGINYTQFNDNLPEGVYNFCFEVYDVFSGQVISQKSCTSVYLILNDPPFLNVPGNSDLVTALTPQNIIFNWTPRHMNATNVQYEFTLKELWDTEMDPQASFLVSPVLHQENTFATTLLYGPANVQLLEGKTYGWQVRALVSDGISETSVFRNEGYSEIYYFNYQADCAVPTFAISQAVNSQTVTITWQTSDHLRYEVQYRKKGYGDDDWFSAYAYKNETTIRNLEAGITYEFRVGGECTTNGGFAYNAINEFTTATEDEEAYYNCGVLPEINIDNQDPLPTIGATEVFTAGDFPVVVVEASGSNGIFSGWGYITLPFLAKINQVINVVDNTVGEEEDFSIGKYTRIRVEFSGININTDYQLINGIVETSYDADWKSMITIPTTQQGEETVEAEPTSGEQPTTEGEEVAEGENTNPESETTITEGTTTDPPVGEGTTVVTTDPPTGEGTTITEGTTDPPPPDGETTTPDGEPDTVAVINHNGTDYNNGDTIEVPYNEDEPYFAFTLKNYPESAEINWQILKMGIDTESKYAVAEMTNDNLGIDMKNEMIFDIVANYNDVKISITIKRKIDEFNLVQLSAFDTENETRKALSGEILYFINPVGLTETYKNVEFEATISPDLDKKKLYSQSLIWSYKDLSYDYASFQAQDFGVKKIERSLPETDNIITTTLEAGHPNRIEKSVEIKWIEKDYDKNKNVFDYGFDLMPYLKDLARKMGIPVYEEEGKYATDTGFSILADTSYETITENKEDSESRLVYNEKKQILKTKLGIKGKKEQRIPSLSIPTIDEVYFGYKVKVQGGVYFFIEGNAYGEVGHTKFIEDWIEEKNTRNREYTEFGEPSQIVLNGRIGLEPKFTLEAGSNVKIYAGAPAELNAQILRYDFIESTISFPIIEEGFQIKCVAKAFLEITVLSKKYNYTHEWDPFIYNVIR